MRKNEISKAKVYADFFTGVSVAWFSAGVVSPYFSKSFSIETIILGLFSFVATYQFLKFAIMFRRKE